VHITTDRGTVRRTIARGSVPNTVTVAPGETRDLRITIAKVWKTHVRRYQLGAGIIEVALPGVTFHPAMRLPTDGLAAFAKPGAQPPILSLYDPVDNPYLDFTGPVTPTPPIARKFTLPQSMAMAISGSAVPVPGPALEQLLTTTATPTAQEVQISASSWLRDLPRFRPENLVERSSLPWVAGLDDPHPSVTLRWPGERSVDSVDLGLDPAAARPTEITVTSPAGSRTVSVPPGGGTVRFAPMTTDMLNVQFTAVTRRTTAQPVGPTTVGVPNTPVVVPVGLSSISVPALGYTPPAPVPSSTPVALACGSGPSVDVDGTSVPTSATGTLGDLIDLLPMAYRACRTSSVPLSSGRHVMSFPAGGAMRMTVLLGSGSPGPTAVTTTTAAAPARTTRVVHWAAADRTIEVGPGAGAYLQLSQNYSPGWVATMDGHTLTSIQLDGWQQGWRLPAGSGGTVTMTFRPDGSYRLGLGLGAVFLVLLACLALLGRRTSSYDAVGPRRRLPFALLTVVAFGVTLVIGGPLMVVVLLLLLLAARRWGSTLMAGVAGLSFFAAGVAVAVHPIAVPAAHLGAFSPLTQFLSVAAVGAVMCAVVIEDGRRPTTGRPTRNDQPA